MSPTKSTNKSNDDEIKPAGQYPNYYLGAFSVDEEDEDEEEEDDDDDDDDVVYVGTTANPDAPKFSCTIEGAPVSQSRIRVAKKGGAYYDPRTNLHKKKIQAAFKANLPKSKELMFPRRTPLRMYVTFFLPRPKYHFAKASRREPKFIKQQYLGCGVLAVTKKDVDNLAKMVMDAGNKILYHDDEQVTQLIATKLYHTTGACTGYTMVRVEQMNFTSCLDVEVDV